MLELGCCCAVAEVSASRWDGFHKQAPLGLDLLMAGTVDGLLLRGRGARQVTVVTVTLGMHCQPHLGDAACHWSCDERASIQIG